MNGSKEGKLIVFEGAEGSGKSTQIRFLEKKLEKTGIKVIATKEPWGEDARKKLHWGNPSLEEELDLFLRDRNAHFRYLVIPALKRGEWVLTDRCSGSTESYQHDGRGLDLKTIKKKDKIARRGRSFDMVILLDMDPAESLKRITWKKDRFEKESLEFHRRVRNGYLRQAKEEPEKWLVIDGRKKEEEIAGIIWMEILKRFILKGRLIAGG